MSINTATIKDTLQDCNLNFLVGSGLSRPFLPTLGKIEQLLTELTERDNISGDTSHLIRASLYKKYFDDVICPNLKVLESSAETTDIRNNYNTFLKTINSVLLRRKTTIIGKSANLFTTNIDIFIDKALEELGLEYNDGFTGRFQPRFGLSNFKKSHFMKSSHYDNTSELPVFNLLKLHGSLSWALSGKDIAFSCDLAHVEQIESKSINPNNILVIPDDATIDSLVAAAAGKSTDASTQAFVDAYEKLLIVVNPTKDKFKHTLLNQTYYELLRLYSNELEKESTVLFAMGFSFADEHISEITLRAANSNPTLIIYVIAYNTETRDVIEGRLGSHAVNANIRVIGPDRLDDGADSFQYDFENINRRILNPVLHEVESVGSVSDGPQAATPLN
jgi:hypothetical protein